MPSLVWRKGGDILSNPADCMVTRFDDLPRPARDLCPDLSVYRPPVGAFRRKSVASVITSRGCTHRFIFCDNSTFGRKVRFFSAGYVAEEIRALVRDVAGWSASLRIRTTSFFMVGHHIDTRETIDETVRLALSLPFSVVTVNTPIPGTASCERAREYVEYREDDRTFLNCRTPVFAQRGLTEERLLQKQAELHRRLYQRPRVLFGQLGRKRDSRGLTKLVRGPLQGYRSTLGGPGRKPAGRP